MKRSVSGRRLSGRQQPNIVHGASLIRWSGALRGLAHRRTLSGCPVCDAVRGLLTAIQRERLSRATGRPQDRLTSRASARLIGPEDCPPPEVSVGVFSKGAPFNRVGQPRGGRARPSRPGGGASEPVAKVARCARVRCEEQARFGRQCKSWLAPRLRSDSGPAHRGASHGRHE